ncbi:MAG: glycoside hydrolase family protein, partial [Candidatus Avelusimicrobium sp.]
MCDLKQFTEEVLLRIRRAEEFSNMPYQCPAGHLTIGYGHNLEHGISAEAAEFILREDVSR